MAPKISAMQCLILLLSIQASAFSLDEISLFGEKAIISPTKTISHNYDRHGLIRRQTAGSPTVDLTSMPTCEDTGTDLCSNPQPGDLSCPTVKVPCPPGDGSSNCTSYDIDCYCNLAAPLACAWECPSWLSWMLDEDWFAQVCPDVQPVDFSQIPDCASDCIQSASIDYGCITGGRNCVCLHDSLYQCPQACNSDDQAIIAEWFAQECNMTVSDATDVVTGGLLPTSTAVIQAGPKSSKLHWYEVFVLVVICSTFSAIALGAFLWR